MTFPKSVWVNLVGLIGFISLISVLLSYFSGDVIFSLAGYGATNDVIPRIKLLSRAVGACFSMLVLWGGLVIPAELLGVLRLYKRDADYSLRAKSAVRSAILVVAAAATWIGVAVAGALFQTAAPVASI